MTHYADCPTSTDETARCECEAIEDAQIERASRPSPAELIRRAKDKGLINATVQQYGGADKT